MSSVVLALSVSDDDKVYDKCGNNIDFMQNITISKKGKFNKAIHFNGSSGIRLAPNSNRNFDTVTDFTLSVWLMYLGVGGGYSTIACRTGYYGGGFSATCGSTSNPYCTFQDNTGYKQLFSSTGWSFTDDLWHHICVTRQNGISRLFCDGIKQQEASFNMNFTLSEDTLGTAIGNDGVQSNSYLHAYLEDLIVINGIALWTSDFTPPTQPLTLPKLLYVKDNKAYGVK